MIQSGKPLSVFAVRLVRRVPGLTDGQPKFYVAASSRAAAIRAFDAARLRGVTATVLKDYGNVWPVDRIPNPVVAEAVLAEPGVVFASGGMGFPASTADLVRIEAPNA